MLRLCWVMFLAACEDDDRSTPGDTDTTPGEDPCEVSGNVCTWLGVPGDYGFPAEGTDRRETLLFGPVDVAFAFDGTAYTVELYNHLIRRVDADDIVTTVSGTGMVGDGPNNSGIPNCWAGCDALESAWSDPTHVALDPADETQLYVAAWHNNRLNRIDTVTSTMFWLAGTGGAFYGPGLDPATAELPPEQQVFRLDFAVLDRPSSIVFGPDGTLYFSDQANHLVRKITPGSTKVEIAVGQIESALHPTTMLPTFIRTPGFEGDGGDALFAKLHGTTDSKPDPGSKIASDPANHRLLIADTKNGVIRAYDYDTKIITTIAGRYESAGTGTQSDGVTGIITEYDLGSVPGYSGDGGDALAAAFNLPSDVAIGIDGEIYVADTKNHCVRVVRHGIVDRFAGVCDPGRLTIDGDYFEGDGAAALDARFTDIYGVEVDAEGNLYIADFGNHVIRRVKR